jgi:hypothetical protein
LVKLARLYRAVVVAESCHTPADHSSTTLRGNDMTYPNSSLDIDIPVKLDYVTAVCSVANLSFEGDLPASLFHIGLITGDIAERGEL